MSPEAPPEARVPANLPEDLKLPGAGARRGHLLSHRSRRPRRVVRSRRHPRRRVHSRKHSPTRDQPGRPPRQSRRQAPEARPRHSREGRNPEGNGRGRSLPHHSNPRTHPQLPPTPHRRGVPAKRGSQGRGADAPPPPVALVSPHTPIVVTAKAGIQGRGAAPGRLSRTPPRVVSCAPTRHSCEGRNPEGNGRGRRAPPPTPVASPDSPTPRRRGASRSARPAAVGPPPPPAALARPHSPIVIPAKAGIQGRSAERGRLRLLSFPHHPDPPLFSIRHGAGPMRCLGVRRTSGLRIASARGTHLEFI